MSRMKVAGFALAGLMAMGTFAAHAGDKAVVKLSYIVDHPAIEATKITRPQSCASMPGRHSRTVR